MTSYATATQKCSVCGVSTECTVLRSTNAFGSPDLDLRPPEMARSTLANSLQECPACGYVSHDLSTVVSDAKGTIQSASYRALSAASGIPGLARNFARYSLLQHAEPEAAGFALIRAAWACDDAESHAEGKRFRSQAADILLALQPFDEQQATLAAVLVDVLRRAERFGEARSLATTLGSFNAVKANKVMVAVLQYQCRLCDRGDTGCYTIADADDAGA